MNARFFGATLALLFAVSCVGFASDITDFTENGSAGGGDPSAEGGGSGRDEDGTGGGSDSSAGGGTDRTGGGTGRTGGGAGRTGGGTGGGGGSVSTGGGSSSGGGRGGGSATGGGATGGSGGGTSTGGGTGGGKALENFSFFVTSYTAIQQLSGSAKGFGGDLRFGETGPGSGLRGADKICSTIAEKSMPGSSAKVWRAFLSATADEQGKQVNAIDRVGNGPWYDRLGRKFAEKKADLLAERPTSIAAVIKNDLPNEDGVPNHSPDGTQVDNHDMLTGSDDQGKLYGPKATCSDWTTTDSTLGSNRVPLTGLPRVGHSWPRGDFPGGFDNPMNNWMSALDEAGCGAGVNLVDNGPPDYSNPTVGSGGGYGGFYCFALSP